jgi:aerobic carbon-monoxide dehydrogenase large subunit
VARLVLSAFYNVAPEHKLRVIAPDVGGGFGSKIYIYPEEITCLWASMKTKRSVKWTSDRSEAFMTDAHGRDHITTAKMGFDANGKITGFKVDTIANFGAYMSLFSSAVPTYLYATLLSGQYDIKPTSTPTSARSTRTPCPSTPIAARAARGLLPHRADDGDGGARDGDGPGRTAPAELHHRLPAPDARHHGL